MPRPILEPNPHSSAGRARPILAAELTAAALAGVSLISVAILLWGELFGSAVWTGFVWLAMFGLPCAFFVGGVLVVANIRRRRSS